MATTSVPNPTKTPNADAIAQIEPPVPLEEELHLIFHFVSKGLLPITEHKDTQGQAQNPFDTIHRMTQQIKKYLPMIEKDVRQCGHLILFENEQHMEAFFRKSTEHLESIYRYRHARMYCLTKHICGEKAETRWHKFYSIFQYMYHDLGHDYLLAKQLHEKMEARWEGLFDPELRKLISDRFLQRKNAWIKNRENLTTWLGGALTRSRHVMVPLEFLKQLNDDPPRFTNRYDGDNLASFEMMAARLDTPSIQSPWMQLFIRQSSDIEVATQSQADDQQPNDLDSKVGSTSNGSSSKTKEVDLPRR